MKNNPKTGEINSAEYNSWTMMKQRCYNPNRPDYKNYGGRGIKVCQRWLESFNNFYQDMGIRPPNHTLDRVNNDRDYCPENCKWSNRSEQNSNQRRKWRQLEYMGEKRPISQWGKIKGIGLTTLHERLDRGWSVEEALTTPVRGK